MIPPRDNLGPIEPPHEAGGMRRLPLPEGVRGEENISADGRYRQRLIRDWTPQGVCPRSILWIGMNPSIADSRDDDPTCRRERQVSVDLGYSRYLKGNVLDWRATEPRNLPNQPNQACSADNLPNIVEMAREAEIVVIAHGNMPQRYVPIINRTIEALRRVGKPLFVLGRNATGHPKHILRMSAELNLEPF